MSSSSIRIDGRQKDEYRPLKVCFGLDDSCLVTLGNTKVISHITSLVAEPRLTRPSEGLINVRVDASDEHVELSRLLHKMVKDCVDLEALCIIGGEKVWSVTIDVAIVNNEGNSIEAASFSVLSALSHYKRPDVSVAGGSVTVHPIDRTAAQRFVINHLPFLMKFVFFKNQASPYSDPIEEEEKSCEGYLIVGSNNKAEITCLHISGLVTKAQILKQCDFAVRRSRDLNKLLSCSQSESANMFDVLAHVY